MGKGIGFNEKYTGLINSPQIVGTSEELVVLLSVL